MTDEHVLSVLVARTERREDEHEALLYALFVLRRVGWQPRLNPRGRHKRERNSRVRIPDTRVERSTDGATVGR